jgi:DNA-binding NtrC family response regulator
MSSLLVVEDDPIMATSLDRTFRHYGYTITVAETVEEASRRLETEIYDLVLADLRLNNGSGLEVLTACKRLQPDTEVIIMTAFGTVETAVQAIQSGASDYITKPFKNQELLFKVERAMERIGLKNEVRYLRQEIAHKYGFDNIIGASKPIADLKRIVSRIADKDIAVLITGESGTGKDLFAKVIHHHSHRRQRPFVPINCSAIPESLIESELFGHVKGAFTSAVANKRGLFEEADRGTIFLDEVADLPYPTQAKLLRVLQEKEIRPVGGTATRPIDVRIVAATNADLAGRVREGRFREDLYYRLNVMPIHIPPLRERPEDIPLLVKHFLREINSENEREDFVLSSDAMQLLLDHDWPGNARELDNTLKRAVALSRDGQVSPSDIIFISPRARRMSIQPANIGNSLAEQQRLQILKTLENNDWNYSLTAKELGIGRTTLWRKVKKFNLKQPAEA